MVKLWEVSPNELRDFLARFSYRPDWHFALSYEYHHPVPLLRANCVTEDVHTGRQVVLTALRPIPYLLAHNWKNRMAYEVWALIEQLEAHERLEWFKFEGEWVWSPHPNGGSASTPGGPPF